MKSIAKSLIRSLIAQFGYEIKRTYPTFPGDAFQVQKALLERIGVDNPIIFDVGANRGQTAIKYRELFPGASIYSFEPFPDSFAELKQRLANDVAFRAVPMAVTNNSGTRDFHVFSDDVTNSLLPRPESERRYYHSSAEPEGVITVPTTTLDEFVSSENIGHVDILKFDIQGGELIALEGAKEILAHQRASCIYLEILFVPLYEGAPLFHDIWKHLEQYNYTLFNIYDLQQAINGQLKYGDALFISSKLRKEEVDNYDKEP